LKQVSISVFQYCNTNKSIFRLAKDKYSNLNYASINVEE